MQIKSRHVLRVVSAVAVVLGAAAAAQAGQTNVAVAANFTEAAEEIAQAFKQKTGHEAILSFGSTGQFYTQITQDAPFEVFLAADDERPKKAVDEGFAVAGQPVHLCDRQARAVEQGPGSRARRGDADERRFHQARASPIRSRRLMARLRSRR